MSRRKFGKLHSPVSQDFIWLAEYLNGTLLTEFNYSDKKENNFYQIDRNNLYKFGLVGHGYKFCFNVLDGIFNIAGKNIEIFYKTNNKIFNLTNTDNYYNDIIQYKDAISTFNPYNQNIKLKNNITQYNFGYKTKINYEDNNIQFNFKPIVKVPFNKPIYLTVWLVCNKNLDGYIVIKKNKITMKEIYAPLKEGVGGKVNWIIK